ncbi:MAG: hypothetical protein GWM90_29985, partial [Gemmatimonadetes bacterium]|nr:hypothetical protein [Gemmatimonadota bacterium]NIQ59320.1 hypothetical protein [Gemmatimonadota bacterium]NIU79506.1 hypothetical protein [Gammaproteobacteria bacterium]NIX48142.1 hypothetical protein [Gemmatimonadota bacterium]NIY12532.1 hypothetical protein [Gemmatimonadota bacterium]
MRRAHHILLGLLVLATATACDNGTPWDGGGEAAAGRDRHDFGPTGAFDRRLLFVGPGADLPTAAVFDFVALSDSVRIRRGARLRLLEGGRWV